MEHPDVSEARATPDVRIGDRAFVVETLAADIEAEANRPRRGAFTIAIPGGSVARVCFSRLATLALDWSMVEVFWVDERAVSQTDAESNYRLARELWLEPAGIPARRFHRMMGEAPDLERAARDYADELKAIAGDPPRIDYVLLGVGEDGHVASLFPGHPALFDQGPVLAIEDAPVPPPRRLSLSLPVLVSAARVVMVAFGTTKARVMAEVAADPGSTLPAAQVARRARRCLLLIDREAGARVEGRG